MHGCGLCLDACLVEAVIMDGGKAVVDMGQRVEYGRCVDECPGKTIRIP